MEAHLEWFQKYKAETDTNRDRKAIGKQTRDST